MIQLGENSNVFSDILNEFTSMAFAVFVVDEPMRCKVHREFYKFRGRNDLMIKALLWDSEDLDLVLGFATDFLYDLGQVA